MESQLDERTWKSDNLRRQLQETEARTGTEATAARLRLEVEGLRQLEKVRKQFDERYTKFDEERAWHRHEHDQDLALIADLCAPLVSEHSSGESHEPYNSVESLRDREGEHVDSRQVTFDIDGVGGHGICPPTSQRSFTLETTNGTSCDSGTNEVTHNSVVAGGTNEDTQWYSRWY